jgi:hypothetical protein
MPVGPLLKILGPELPHEWSYYFQRAQFERQLGQWKRVSGLKIEAAKKGYQPQDPLEWLPFIEADVMNRDYDSALAQTKTILSVQPYAVASLRLLWGRILESAGPSDPELAAVARAVRAEIFSD